VLVEELHIKKQ